MATATAQALCENVQVKGDAAFCVQGPICAGTSDQPDGLKCPKARDTAVAACTQDMTSWRSNGACVASQDAICLRDAEGHWGCEWPTSNAISFAADTTSINSNSSASTPWALGLGGLGVAGAIAAVVTHRRRLQNQDNDDAHLRTPVDDGRQGVRTPVVPASTYRIDL
ncbi:TPA: hypothetical protein N0F65_012697 [Lagenidium giganteum]|uniref:Uncharacterized protein n=1 Tax=Lagenidium giganteum TaxID=4803 RepID=A0AAV2YA28_9STRA|nr:TPA: hypothetical protein N0F65_012697 [Lagenidium giganteum]